MLKILRTAFLVSRALWKHQPRELSQGFGAVAGRTLLNPFRDRQPRQPHLSRPRLFTPRAPKSFYSIMSNQLLLRVPGC
jgi:hypothetical protein